MRVLVDDSPLVLGGLRQRSVLALLLLAKGAVLSNDSLADALWADEPPPTASKTVQVYVSRLRALLAAYADRIAFDSSGYRLTLGDGDLDADRFEGLLARARALAEQGDHPFAVSVLDEALGLWRGAALADFAYESFAETEAGRLEELRLEAIELRFASLVESGAADAVLASLRQAVTDHPYREGLWRSLAIGLYRAGRQADALEALRSLRKMLDSELGIDPSPDIQALEVSILNQDAALDRRRRQPLSGRTIQPSLTRLIGREREVAEVSALLTDHRLTTITGVGGTGKTRLAEAVGLALEANHPDGVYFVDLAPIRDASLVPSAVASVLGIDAGGAPSLEAALQDALVDRRALIVLDNFEQVREAGDWAGRLLGATRHLRILVTSRAAVRIRGERRYVLEPLQLVEGPATPDAVSRSAAVQLLLDRAAGSGARLEVTPANASTLAELCRRLDGLPLAIELAAARARVLPLEEILARLDQHVSFLSAGPRDLPDRQRTLRATLEWSHDLLNEREARLLRQLAVFVGGFTTAAAEAVCGDADEAVVDDLAGLVDHHLVRRFEADGTSRFGMLETIRDYAVELLDAGDDPDEQRRRHAAFFTDLAEGAEQTLKGAGQRDALATLSAERGNLRAALRWTLGATEAETGLRLASALRSWWELHGQSAEGRQWLDALLELPGPGPGDLRARALSHSGALAFRQGDHADARDRHAKALEIRRRLGDALGVAKTLNNLAIVADERGDYAEASDLMAESVVAWRQSGDRWGLAIALGNTGGMFASQLRFDEASMFLLESIELSRANGDAIALAMGLTELGIVLVFQDRLDEAEGRLGEALGLVKDLDAPHDTACALQGDAEVAMARRDLDTAQARLGEALALALQAEEHVEVARCLERVGRLLALRGDGAAAARVWACASRVRRERGAPMYPLDRSCYEPAVARARGELGDDAFDRAWSAGLLADPEMVGAALGWSPSNRHDTAVQTDVAATPRALRPADPARGR